jgi:hypothetical protein
MQRVDSKTLARAQAQSFNLQERTERLELIAEWAAELRRVLEAALNPLDTAPDIDWLKEEVARFKLACRGVRS